MSYPNPDESENQDGQLNEAEIEAKKEIILRQILDSNARMRLNNIKMVKPDLAATVENYLIGSISQGKIRSQITDEQLKQILLSIQQPKREFKINRR